jgi:hypothetical protein
MPGFQRLMDTLESDTMDELCRRFAGFFHYAEILDWSKVLSDTPNGRLADSDVDEFPCVTPISDVRIRDRGLLHTKRKS